MEPQQLAAPVGQQTVPLLPRKSVLNVGFGMGIIDTYLQEQHQPVHHIINEAHPDVYQCMLATGWVKESVQNLWEMAYKLGVCFDNH